ncbi:MAG: hypothetical protein JXB14_04280 [Candidatus Altiarchaeota archaeon]|nr:hypothetical protein [Candidatus Altiarchaeota archaeon]
MKLRRALTLLVLVVLIMSNVPVGLAQTPTPPAEPVATTPISPVPGSTSSEITSSGSCDVGRLTGQDVQNLYDNIYGPGRNFDNLIGNPSAGDEKTAMNEDSTDQIVKNFMDSFKPSREGEEGEETGLKEGEMGTPDGEHKFDFQSNCKSCSSFPLPGGSDVPYFACTKGSPNTRVQYCDDAVEDCAKPIDSKAAVTDFGEKLLSWVWDENDLLLSINGFQFNQKNGNFVPSDFNSLIYSDTQKRYDNLLPVFTVAGFFAPTPALFKGLYKTGKKTVSWFSDAVSGIGRSDATTAAAKGMDIASRANRVEGTSVVTASQRLRDDIYGAADDIAKGNPTRLTTGLDDIMSHADDLKGGIDDAEETVLGILRNYDKEVVSVNSKTIDRIGRTIEQECFAAKTKLCLKELQDLHDATLAYYGGQQVRDASAIQILRLTESVQGQPALMSADDALEALKTLGLKDSDVSKALTTIGDYYTAIDRGDDVAKNAAKGRLVGSLAGKNVPLQGDQTYEAIAQSLLDAGAIDRRTGEINRAGASQITATLKNWGFNPFGADDMIDNPAAGIASLEASIERNLHSTDNVIEAMKNYGQITAAQESRLKRLGRVVTGTTTTGRQAILRAFYKEGFVYFVAHSPAAVETPEAKTQQITFAVDSKSTATNTRMVNDYLGGEAPYIEILSQDSAYLEGFHAFLSLIHVPEAVERWMGYMNWRLAGGAEKPPGPVELEPACRGDGNIVKDTVWVFRGSEPGDTRFVSYEGPIDFVVSSGMAVIDSSGQKTTHSYVSEVDPGCLPTTIVKTHGVDIKSEVWKSSGLGVDAIKKLMDSLTGKSAPDKVEANGRGVLFENYLTTDEEERCEMLDFDSFGEFFKSGGWGLTAQLIPVMDIIFAPLVSYHMANCVDTDYWVHFTVNENQAGLENLLGSFDFGGSKEELSDRTEPPKAEGGTATGAVVSGLLEGRTYEKAEIASPSGMQTSTDTIDTTAEELAARDTKIPWIEGFENFVKEFGEKGEAYLKQKQTEQDIQTLNARTFWLHGIHDQGVYGVLKIEGCCWMYVKGKSWTKPPSATQQTPVAMPDHNAPQGSGKDKAILVITPQENKLAMKAWDDANKKFRDLFDMQNFWVSHMYQFQPEAGRIIPYEVRSSIYDPSNDDVLFAIKRQPNEKDIPLRVGDYGPSSEVKKIINCIVDYINSRLSKSYSFMEYDNALKELGAIESIHLEDGTKIDQKEDKFVVAGPGGVNSVSNLEIKVNRDVLLDSILIGKAEVIHTKRGQVMWDTAENKIYVWLTVLAQGKGSEFSPAQDSDQDGLSDEQEAELGTNPNDADTDDDGVNDGEEISNNTDPLDPDTDNDTTPDGLEDSDGDGVKDADECNFDGLALDLGPELKDALTLIGPIMSFETTDSEVTFIAEEVGNDCIKHLRICDRETGECDKEIISSYKVEGRLITITTNEGHKKLLEFGRDAKGNPTLKSTHYDQNGQIVDDTATFEEPEAVEKIRGTKGIAVYDPETGEWTFFNGFDLPMNPSWGNNGATFAPVANYSGVSGAPVNVFTGDTGKQQDTPSSGNLLAQLPWVPDESPIFILFVVFLLMVTLLIRKNFGGENGS